MKRSYLLIRVSSGGYRDVVLVADSRAELMLLLESKGYYFSQKVGRYIDDHDGRSSGVDYELGIATKYEQGMSYIPMG